MCPSGEHAGELGPRRPRADALVRFCLPCSTEAGRLIQRRCPTVERERARRQVQRKAKATRQRATATRRKVRARDQAEARYQWRGVDLREEFERYRKLPVFRGSRVAKDRPGFGIRHARRLQSSQVGFASPSEWRIHVTTWPTAPLDTVRDTIIHELVHLCVGRADDGWHGISFKRTLTRALTEAGLSTTTKRWHE